MRTFQEIFEISAGRQDGAAALEAKLGKPRSAEELAAIPEDRWLAELSKFVFRTGLNWSVIENKWPGFEEEFHGFDIGRCAMMDDAMSDLLLALSPSRPSKRRIPLPATLPRVTPEKLGILSCPLQPSVSTLQWSMFYEVSPLLSAEALTPRASPAAGCVLTSF